MKFDNAEGIEAMAWEGQKLPKTKLRAGLDAVSNELLLEGHDFREYLRKKIAPGKPNHEFEQRLKEYAKNPRLLYFTFGIYQIEKELYEATKK